MPPVDVIHLQSTQSSAKSLVHECLTEAGRVIDKDQEKNWSQYDFLGERLILLWLHC